MVTKVLRWRSVVLAALVAVALVGAATAAPAATMPAGATNARTAPAVQQAKPTGGCDKYHVWETAYTSDGKSWVCKCTKVNGEWQDCDWVEVNLVIPPGPANLVYNDNSDLVVDLRGAGTGDGTAIQQYGYDGLNAQLWHLRLTGGGPSYTVTNDRTGKCVGVSGASPTQGAPIVQWTCNGSPDQEWVFTFDGNHHYNIRDLNTGQCLAVPGGAVTPQLQLVQWTCNGHPDQAWHLG